MNSLHRTSTAALFFMAAVLPLQAVAADVANMGLRALGRRSRGNGGATIDADSNAEGQAEHVHVVRLYKYLERKPASMDEGNTSRQDHERRRHAYLGRLDVGYPVPQPLLVSFDTASGNVMVPALECQSASCKEHRHYYASGSTTAVAINADGSIAKQGPRARDHVEVGISTMDFGDGRLSGELLLESVCVGGASDSVRAAVASSSGTDDRGNRSVAQPFCGQLGMVVATSMQEVPFLAMPQDGVVGLGLKHLSVSPRFNFLEHMQATSSLSPTFAVFLADQWGELSLGGHQANRLAGPLMWLPVPKHRREEGYWQVAIRAIRVGNETLNVCPATGCRGIVDTSASSIGTPRKLLPTFQDALAATHSAGNSANSACSGPELHIDLSTGKRGAAAVTLTLRPQDYFENFGGGSKCQARLAAMDLPEEFSDVVILGEPVLRRYYTVYEQGGEGSAGPRIGFGLAAAPSAQEDAAVVTARGAATAELDRDVAAAVAQAEAVAAAAARAVAEANEGAGFRYSLFGLHGKLDMLAHFAVIQLLLTLIVAAPNMLRMGVAKIKGSALADVIRLACLQPVRFPPPATECAICLGSFEDDCCGCGMDAEVTDGADEKDTNQLKAKSSPCARWSKLRCGHSFHEGCILQWLKRAERCPVCRAPL